MPKKVNHISRRAEIAKAAITSIADRGLDNVRMVDIARACNATTGPVVHILKIFNLEHIFQRLECEGI